MSRKVSTLITSILAGFLAACSVSPLETPTNTPAPSSTPTSTELPTRTPRPTATLTPTPNIPSQITIEFGDGVFPQEEAKFLAGVSHFVTFYESNGFGEPQEAVIIASHDRSQLIEQSYEMFNKLAPQDKEQWTRNLENNFGAMNMIVDGKGYIFIDLSYPYWNESLFATGKPTRGDCAIGNELLHLWHQWLSGINFVDAFGTNPRSPNENGPNWLILGKEQVLCGYSFGIPETTIRARQLVDLGLVPSTTKFRDRAITPSGTGNTDEVGYMRQSAVYFLLFESPGGKNLGPAKSLATYFHGLADPSLTWQEVFFNTWGWTPDQLIDEFEKNRSTLNIP